MEGDFLPGPVQSGSRSFKISIGDITMSEITAQTTVAELVTAFGLSSISDLVSRLERKTSKPKSGETDQAVLEMAQTVWTVISEKGSSHIKWKSGILTKAISNGTLLPEFDDDPELKRQRYAMHALIGQALKHLHDEGVLEKPDVKTRAQTHYKMIEGAQYGTQAEEVEVEVLGLPGPVEEIQEAEIVEEVQVVETPKPKARTRRRRSQK